MLVLLCPALVAQQPGRPDIIRGRVVGPDSQPVAGARVAVRSEESNEVRETVTTARGAWTVLFPTHSEKYVVTTRFIGMEPSIVRVKWRHDDAVLTANVALVAARHQLERVTVREHPRPRPVRDDAQSSGDAGFDAGAFGDVREPRDGWWNQLDAKRYSVLGGDPSENTLTVNGAEVRTVLPNPIGLSGHLSAASGDVSQAGTSSGRLAVGVGSGGVYHLRYIDVNAAPASLQWVDESSDEAGMRSTTLDASLWAFDPLFNRRVRHNTTLTVSRRTTPLPAFPTSSEGLARLGLAPDSLARFLGVIAQSGIPVTVAAMPDQQRTTRASWITRLDFSDPNVATPTNRFNVVMNIGTERADASGASPAALASHAGSQTQTGGFISATLDHLIGTGFLTTLSTTLNGYSTRDDPYLALPEGRVRVRSALSSGDSTLTWLTFGGNAGAGRRTHVATWQAHAATTWVTYDTTHQFRVGGDVFTERQRAEEPLNALGTFEFESLEALEAGRAMRYTRQTTSPTTSASGVRSALYLDDRWTLSPSLMLKYGLRLDMSRTAAAIPYNSAVDDAFGRRTDVLPRLTKISPRATLQWSYGSIAHQSRLAFSVGREQSPLGASAALAAARASGLSSATRLIDCVGDAVPFAAWSSYEGDPGTIPSTCLDGAGGQQVDGALPAVRLFDPSYQPPVAWRSTLSWFNSAWTEFQLSIATSRGTAQRSTVDLNLDPTPRFTLPAERGRPVYAPLAAVVPATGATALADSRRNASFGPVLATLSDMRSRATEVVFGKIIWIGKSFGIYPQYRYLTRSEQARGFDQGSAGDPFAASWGRSPWPHHTLRLNLRGKLSSQVDLIARPWVQSGVSYTPLVAGDINGDGAVNDIAYIPQPSTELGQEMLESLHGAPASVLRCIGRQYGQIAGRNSCTGPWSGGMDLSLEISPPNFYSGGILIHLVNAAGAADRLIHGSAHTRGWGDPAVVDPTLFAVTSFDPSARQFRYQVNPRFGQHGGISTWHQPIELRIEVRTWVGPSLQTQQNHTMAQRVRANRDDLGRVLPFANPFAEIAKRADDLHLTVAQRDSLQAIESAWRPVVDSIQAELSGYIEQVSDTVSDNEVVARVRASTARIAEATASRAPALRALLTEDQLGLLPSALQIWIIRKAEGAGDDSGFNQARSVPEALLTSR